MLMQRPGYAPANQIVAEARDGRIAAHAGTWYDGVNRLGHFEPVGTHRDFRRRGLARAVMLDAMHRMKARGMVGATVSHNADNVAARALYRSLGFRRCHDTLGYRKRVPENV